MWNAPAVCELEGPRITGPMTWLNMLICFILDTPGLDFRLALYGHICRNDERPTTNFGRWSFTLQMTD
jgi:hypothetical protein